MLSLNLLVKCARIKCCRDMASGCRAMADQNERASGKVFFQQSGV